MVGKRFDECKTAAARRSRTQANLTLSINHTPSTQCLLLFHRCRHFAVHRNAAHVKRNVQDCIGNETSATAEWPNGR